MSNANFLHMVASRLDLADLTPDAQRALARVVQRIAVDVRRGEIALDEYVENAREEAMQPVLPLSPVVVAFPLRPVLHRAIPVHVMGDGA